MPQVVASDDDDGGDDDGGDDAAAGHTLNTDMDLGQDSDGLAVKVNAIDAYWLQRQIAEAFAAAGDTLDAASSQEKERHVLRLLGSTKEAAELEGDLVYYLDYKRFDLIKVRLSPAYVRMAVAGALLGTRGRQGSTVRRLSGDGLRQSDFGPKEWPRPS